MSPLSLTILCEPDWRGIDGVLTRQTGQSVRGVEIDEVWGVWRQDGPGETPGEYSSVM